MKHRPWTSLTILALVLVMASCAPAAATTPLPTSVPEVAVTPEARGVQASAKVVPAQESDLSFVISGPVDSVAVKKGDFVQPGQVLVTLRSPELEYHTVQAEDAVRAAELEYKYWKLPRRIETGEIVKRGPVAEQELEVARRSLETVQAELSQAELVAPFAATVVFVEVQPGEFVQPGQAIIGLAKLDNLKVETTDLSEHDIASVKVGQPATVFVEALKKEFDGTVTAISPIADTLGSDVVFKVTIQLKEQPSNLLWGMSADVEIKTE